MKTFLYFFIFILLEILFLIAIQLSKQQDEKNVTHKTIIVFYNEFYPLPLETEKESGAHALSALKSNTTLQ